MWYKDTMSDTEQSGMSGITFETKTTDRLTTEPERSNASKRVGIAEQRNAALSEIVPKGTSLAKVVQKKQF